MSNQVNCKHHLINCEKFLSPIIEELDMLYATFENKDVVKKSVSFNEKIQLDFYYFKRYSDSHKDGNSIPFEILRIMQNCINDRVNFYINYDTSLFIVENKKIEDINWYKISYKLQKCLLKHFGENGIILENNFFNQSDDRYIVFKVDEFMYEDQSSFNNCFTNLANDILTINENLRIKHNDISKIIIIDL